MYIAYIHTYISYLWRERKRGGGREYKEKDKLCVLSNFPTTNITVITLSLFNIGEQQKCNDLRVVKNKRMNTYKVSKIEIELFYY